MVELFVGSIESTVFLVPLHYLFVLGLKKKGHLLDLCGDAAELVSRVVAALVDLDL